MLEVERLGDAPDLSPGCHGTCDPARWRRPGGKVVDQIASHPVRGFDEHEHVLAALPGIGDGASDVFRLRCLVLRSTHPEES